MNHRQHAPIPLRPPGELSVSLPAPRLAIVTPSFNQGQFIAETISSVIGQNYPNLHYHVQDGGSTDGTVDILESRDISWKSEKDSGQGDAINRGFADVTCDVMAYLNSDDMLLPGSLAYVARFFQENPDVDFVYGHRIFIDENGREIGRGVLPPHNLRTLRYVDFVPQETMFWRNSVWQKIGPFDPRFKFALDWDFLLRAQAAGFKMVRLPRFLGAFRIHGTQKNEIIRHVGADEVKALRQRTSSDRRWGALCHVAPYCGKQMLYHWLYRLQAQQR